MARAFEEPQGFKDVKFGDSEQSVRAKLMIPPPTYFPAYVLRGQVITQARTFDPHCHSYSKDKVWLGERFCSWAATVADIRVSASYTFRDDKVVSIALEFKPDAYPQMKAAFLSRFGQPESMKETVVKTGAGVEYLNEALTWRGPTVWIYLTKYVGKVTESVARYELLSELSTSAALRSQQGVKAAEDLK